MTAASLDRYCTNAKNVGRVVLYVPPPEDKSGAHGTVAMIPEPPTVKP